MPLMEISPLCVYGMMKGVLLVLITGSDLPAAIPVPESKETLP